MDKNEERKKAIAAKRKRLEELRRNKARSAAPTASNAVAASAAATTSENPERSDEGLDDLIHELLAKPTTGEPAASVQVASPNPAEKDEEEGENDARTVAKDRPELRVVNAVSSVNIPFRPIETYEKGVQTDAVEQSAFHEVTSPKRRSFRGMDRERTGSIDSGGLGLDIESKEKALNGTETDQNNEAPSPMKEEEQATVETGEDYLSFLNQGVRVIERALKQNSEFDVTKDYGGADAGASSVKESISFVETIFDERWSKGRTITDIQFSPHHKELFLASHTKRIATSDLDWSRGASDPNGVVLVWSLHMARERPEYVFTCQSPVHCALFHPFAANLIIGGTYSGQIVMWDLRAKSVPIQRSLLSPESHTHPVYSMSITGSANAHNLVSLSTDGRLCTWSPGNISQPTDSKLLKWNKKDVTATTLSFPDGETNELCMGGEDGGLFKVQIHGSKGGVHSRSEAHFGPVTSMAFHKGSASTADLFLTSSMDWTVKLWSNRSMEKPMKVFEHSQDYVFDAKWSPTHPALFASGNGSGHLDLWNINQNMEVPQASIKIPSLNEAEGSRPALSSLQWMSNGRRIIAGDSAGFLHIYEVSNEIALPRRDEWNRLENTAAGLIESI